MCNQISFEEEDCIEISVCCYSEKESAGIGFGSSVDSIDNLFKNYEDFDIDTMQESFWENYFEFEDGIEKPEYNECMFEIIKYIISSNHN